MDTFDTITELVDILQGWRNVTNPSLPPIQPKDVLEMVNEQPEMLQEVINLARKEPSMMGLTDSIPDDFTSSFVKEIREDWRFIPSDYVVKDADYNALRKYFDGDRSWFELNERQRTYLDYLAMKPDDFSVDSGVGFEFEHDAANAYNIHEQLAGKLSRDKVFTREMIDDFGVGVGEFPARWGKADVLDSSGGKTQVPGQSGEGNAQRPDQGIEMQEIKKDPSKIAQEVLDNLPDGTRESVESYLSDNYNLSDDEMADVFDEFEDLQIEQNFRKHNEADYPELPGRPPESQPLDMVEKKTARQLMKEFLRKNPRPNLQEMEDFAKESGLEGADMDAFIHKTTREVSKIFAEIGDYAADYPALAAMADRNPDIANLLEPNDEFLSRYSGYSDEERAMYLETRRMQLEGYELDRKLVYQMNEDGTYPTIEQLMARDTGLDPNMSIEEMSAALMAQNQRVLSDSPYL